MKQAIKFGKVARQALLTGISLTNNAVKVTLGPQGKNVDSNHLHGGIWSTKDGIKVIREIAISDQFENAGVKMIREASAETAKAGDATTTTCILATALITAANDKLDSGVSSVKIRKEIEAAAIAASEWVKENAVQIDNDPEKIKHIATISANNNTEIGELISEAFKVTGPDGTITLQESFTGKTEMEILEQLN